MFDTYRRASPDAASNNTVYFNVLSDLAGDSSILQGAALVSNKSVYINGNHKTLYYDNDTNYKTGQNVQNRSIGFYARGGISDQTNATIKDATWVNNQSSGLFPATGAAAKLNQYYINVNEYNGDDYNGAAPINNEGGKIYFSGNNQFNVLYGGDIKASGTNLDTNFEWIRGGQYIEVLDGQTTVNLNAAIDQMIFPNGQGVGQTIKIDDNAKLNWNSGQYWSLYYGWGRRGPLRWLLGEKAEFNIQDIGTSSGTGSWFNTTNFTDWEVEAKTGAKIIAATAGGAINLNAFSNVKWDFGRESELFLENKSNSNLFSGSPTKTSSFNFNDVNQVTLLSQSATVFSNTSKFPINFSGSGLRLHASSRVMHVDDPNDQINYSGSDIWQRVATGSISSGFDSSDMIPKYSSETLKYLQSAKYIKWYHPTGLSINQSQVNRHYRVNLGNLPQDGHWSNLVPASEPMQLNVIDDRGQQPNFAVQVSQLTNHTPNMTKYFWKTADKVDELSTMPIQIIKIIDDRELPSNVDMTMAGGNYAINYGESEGLALKVKNTIKIQSNISNATFLYAIVSGI